jgi:cobalt-zinc-cadmium efflux system outer membrane protein
LLGTALAWAQTDSSAIRPTIGLPEALARTIARNPDLTAFGYQIAAAEGRLQQAGLAPYPELGVEVENAFGTDTYHSLDRAEATVTLGWILERGVRDRRIDAASAGVSLRTVDAEIVRLDAAAETARRFVMCLAYQGRLRNAAEAVRLTEETVEAVTVRVAASRALDADLARAEAELARAELLEEDYEHELLSAYHLLSAQWGETRPDFGSVSGELQALPAVEPFETLLSRAEQNPELARYMSQQRLDVAEVRLAETQSKPSWRVYAGLRRLQLTDDFAVVGGITIPLAVRNRNEGRIAEARANAARTAAEEHAARVRIETALFVLYQELRHNTQLAERLREDVIPRLERALADTRRAYELGRYSYFEWTVVQAELLEANNDLLEASIGAHSIVIEIERLTGVRFALPATAQ